MIFNVNFTVGEIQIGIEVFCDLEGATARLIATTQVYYDLDVLHSEIIIKGVKM